MFNFLRGLPLTRLALQLRTSTFAGHNAIFTVKQWGIKVLSRVSQTSKASLSKIRRRSSTPIDSRHDTERSEANQPKFEPRRYSLACTTIARHPPSSLLSQVQLAVQENPGQGTVAAGRAGLAVAAAHAHAQLERELDRDFFLTSMPCWDWERDYFHGTKWRRTFALTLGICMYRCMVQDIITDHFAPRGENCCNSNFLRSTTLKFSGKDQRTL